MGVAFLIKRGFGAVEADADAAADVGSAESAAATNVGDALDKGGGVVEEEEGEREEGIAVSRVSTHTTINYDSHRSRVSQDSGAKTSLRHRTSEGKHIRKSLESNRR